MAGRNALGRMTTVSAQNEAEQGHRTRISFAVATRSDDLEIRRLLRENPMLGRISTSLEREPDFFADAAQSKTKKQTIVAREGSRVVCVGSCTTRLRFVNGEPRRVGYLGELRLDASVSGRFDILRRGYRFFRELLTDDPPDLLFTSIAADNHRAIRFLERRLPGMPCYEPLCDFVTLLLPVKPSKRRSPTRHEMSHFNLRAGSETGARGTLLPHLEPVSGNYQLAPLWSTEELRASVPLGLTAANTVVVGEGPNPAASAILWDQRSFKQTVIRGYRPWLAAIRPVFNAVAPWLRQPRLPAVGTPLNHAYASHLATPSERPELTADLVAKLMTLAANRGIEILTVGFDANDPRLGEIRSRFPGREYRSRLYRVHWPDLPSLSPIAGIFAPEVSLL
jgi:hypothetical protein